MATRTGLLLLTALTLAACAGHGGAPATQRQPHAAFQRSPGGTAEIAPEALAALLASEPASVRVVDVREREELSGELGMIAGAQWVPLGELAHASESWAPEEPIVLVCRSGRRSARGAAQLESLGFRHVASLTGGMQRFHDLGLPVRHVEPPAAPQPAAEVQLRAGQSAAPVQVDPAHVQWVRTAALLVTGSEACVDGRDPHAVLGTPGGDAGELLLALGTAEEVLQRPLSAAEVGALVRAWIDAFGRVYMHTDEHALVALGLSLREDGRFAPYAIPRPRELEAFVRHPPRELEEPLLARLVDPHHVGCGHLRSMLLAPQSYRMRGELVGMVLRELFEQLWHQPEHIDWVVLSGAHEERAVVVVRVTGPVRPYTKVPAISPASALGQAFVVHPEVTAYLREQHAHFLRDALPALRDRVTSEELMARIAAIAAVQLDATLQRLAPGLPWYEVRFPDGARGAGHVAQLTR